MFLTLVYNFFYINEYERRVYFRLRVPLTFIIVLSLILIILNIWLSRKKPNENENVLLINLQNCNGIESLNSILNIIQQNEIDFKMIRSSINSNTISIVLQINSSPNNTN